MGGFNLFYGLAVAKKATISVTIVIEVKTMLTGYNYLH